ncbi:cell surface glycoprotein 1-like [Schistocerca serialis cubense]|uniref:cell surface glycoprotein 1-like n=1 Tax=Schistocerca serialis cubense TaxID=2023355 RepID=UPI00214F55EF|nr:cell surface glycoprotein 1-like [Schistocerca serialis cubense]
MDVKFLREYKEVRCFASWSNTGNKDQLIGQIYEDSESDSGSDSDSSCNDDSSDESSSDEDKVFEFIIDNDGNVVSQTESLPVTEGRSDPLTDNARDFPPLYPRRDVDAVNFDMPAMISHKKRRRTQDDAADEPSPLARPSDGPLVKDSLSESEIVDEDATGAFTPVQKIPDTFTSSVVPVVQDAPSETPVKEPASGSHVSSPVFSDIYPVDSVSYPPSATSVAPSGSQPSPMKQLIDSEVPVDPVVIHGPSLLEPMPADELDVEASPSQSETEYLHDAPTPANAAASAPRSRSRTRKQPQSAASRPKKKQWEDKGSVS